MVFMNEVRIMRDEWVLITFFIHTRTIHTRITIKEGVKTVTKNFTNKPICLSCVLNERVFIQKMQDLLNFHTVTLSLIKNLNVEMMLSCYSHIS